MLLLQRGALLKRGGWIRWRCDRGRIGGRRGDAVGTMRRRERQGIGGISRVGVFIVVERIVVADAAVVEGADFVGVVGVGAVRVRRMVVGKIFFDVGAVKGAVEAAFITAASGFATCNEGSEALFHALSRRISFMFREFWIMTELSTFCSTVVHFSPTRSARIFHICPRRSL